MQRRTTVTSVGLLVAVCAAVGTAGSLSGLLSSALTFFSTPTSVQRFSERSAVLTDRNADGIADFLQVIQAFPERIGMPIITIVLGEGLEMPAGAVHSSPAPKPPAVDFPFNDGFFSVVESPEHILLDQSLMMPGMEPPVPDAGTPMLPVPPRYYLLPPLPRAVAPSSHAAARAPSSIPYTPAPASSIPPTSRRSTVPVSSIPATTSSSASATTSASVAPTASSVPVTTSSSVINTQAEICTNGIDDDNDGLVDCNDPGCMAHASCTVSTSSSLATEICNNGIDDDGDGLVDCADPGCMFSVLCMSSSSSS
jgi:hypothetical protein